MNNQYPKSLKYDKFIKEEPKTKAIKEENNNKEETVTKESGYDLKNKTNIQVLKGILEYQIVVSKTGDAYLIINEDALSTNSEIDAEMKTSFNNLWKQAKEYNIQGYYPDDNECVDKPNTLKGIKLPVQDVVAAYNSTNGQSIDDAYVVFVKTDGTLSGVNIYDLAYDSKITIKNNIDNLQNISTVVQSATSNGCSGAYQTIAIEKDGTEHILNFE